MIQLRQNLRLTSSFLALVAILSWAICITLAGLLKTTELWAVVKYLGIATLACTIGAVFLNRYLWRWPPITTVLKIPDLSGRWEGWSFRSYTGEWRPCALEIRQQALDISVNAWGPDNWVRGICASIVYDALGGAYELVWSYKTEPRTPNYRQGDAHSGTFFLGLCDKDDHKFLEGRYVTDRIVTGDKMGAGGFIQLVWVSKKLKNTIAYCENEWPIKAPPQPAMITKESQTISGCRERGDEATEDQFDHAARR